jgi:hypothetical protein
MFILMFLLPRPSLPQAATDVRLAPEGISSRSHTATMLRWLLGGGWRMAQAECLTFLTFIYNIYTDHPAPLHSDTELRLTIGFGSTTSADLQYGWVGRSINAKAQTLDLAAAFK